MHNGGRVLVHCREGVSRPGLVRLFSGLFVWMDWWAQSLQPSVCKVSHNRHRVFDVAVQDSELDKSQGETSVAITFKSSFAALPISTGFGRAHAGLYSLCMIDPKQPASWTG